MSEAGKIDPRVKRTRQLLQGAMIDLMQEKPVESVTVQDITERAGVNRATFYAHFEDKNALLNYMVREMYQTRLHEKLPPEPHLTSENLRLLILTTCQYIGEFMDHCAPMRRSNEQAMIFSQVQNYLCETLMLWMRDGDVEAKKTTAVSLSWAIWGATFHWALNGRKITAAQLTDQLLALAQNGLQTYLADEAQA